MRCYLTSSIKNNSLVLASLSFANFIEKRQWNVNFGAKSGPFGIFVQILTEIR